MSDPEQSVTVLEHISRMGVIVSVDDFGTGYSSMSYLRRFPIDKLKIDRGFINELLSKPDDASIVTAIVSVAHSLRLKVVAEVSFGPSCAISAELMVNSGATSRIAARNTGIRGSTRGRSNSRNRLMSSKLATSTRGAGTRQ